MTERFVRPLNFSEAIREVAKAYIHIFKPIIGIVLLAAIVQGVVSLIMPQNTTIGLSIAILANLLYFFFYAWILARGDSVLMNRAETNKDAMHLAKKRFIPVIGVFALYMVLLFILFLFGFGMQYLGNLLHITSLLALLTLAFFLFLFTLLAFTIPAVILDSMPVFKSFEYSARLVWKNWWRTFGVFLVYILPVVLLSLLIIYVVSYQNIVAITIFEFVFHVLVYPIMIAVTLVLYHDLKFRHNKLGFKRVVEHEDHQDLPN